MDVGEAIVEPADEVLFAEFGSEVDEVTVAVLHELTETPLHVTVEEPNVPAVVLIVIVTLLPTLMLPRLQVTVVLANEHVPAEVEALR